MDFLCEEGDKMVTPTIFPHGATFRKATSRMFEKKVQGVHFVKIKCFYTIGKLSKHKYQK
jgi:hypothetical protein